MNYEKNAESLERIRAVMKKSSSLLVLTFFVCFKCLIVGTIFNLAKANTVPCVGAATLSLSDSE